MKVLAKREVLAKTVRNKPAEKAHQSDVLALVAPPHAPPCARHHRCASSGAHPKPTPLTIPYTLAQRCGRREGLQGITLLSF